MSLTRELETLFFIIMVSAAALFAIFFIRQKQQLVTTNMNVPVPNFVFSTPSPTPIKSGSSLYTASAFSPKTTTTSWTSSDGVDTLVMKTTSYVSSKAFDFIISDSSNNSTVTIFNQPATSSADFSLPFNAFSSDNSYVFIKEMGLSNNRYLVFKSSGQPFSSGEQYLEISSLFSAYTNSYNLSDVTGWASPTLLILNTKNPDGSLGSSFWFDVTSKEFIPLANTFQ